MQGSIFSGLRVVELAGVLAGPAVGMFFSELGAEVIKVENATTGGDVTRRWKGPNETADASFSAYYASINYGKDTMMADLTEPADRDKIYQLLADADIVITNFREQSAKKLGMAPAVLRKHSPQLIIAELSAFGRKASRPAFDVVLQAEAGFLFMCGYPGQPPAKMPVALIDLLAAHQLKEGILCALIHRLRTGEGSIVRTSLLEAAIASLANQATNWLMGGHIPQRMGTQHPNIAPYGDMFTTHDGKPIVLAVGTEKQFRQLLRILGCPEVSQHPDFASNARRVQHRESLFSILQEKVSKVKRDVLLSRLEEAGVPAGAIRNMQEVFELPQARSLLLHYKLPNGEPATCVRTAAFAIDVE